MRGAFFFRLGIIGVAFFWAALAAGQEVKVLSFNILDPLYYQGHPWSERFPAIKGVYAHYAADFVLVQELAAVVKDEFYPAFPEYKYIAPAITSGHAAILQYRSARWQLDSSEAGSVPLPVGGKNFAWGRFIEKASGKGIYAASAHYYGDGAQRLSCAQAVAAVLAKRKHKEEPIIHGGDFNSPESSLAITYLEGGAGSPIKLKDTFRALHPDTNIYQTHHGYANGPLTGGDKIDYVMASPEIKVLQAEVYYGKIGGVYPSDHYPVFAKVAFPSAPTALRMDARGRVVSGSGAGLPGWTIAGRWDARGASATLGGAAAGIQFVRVQSTPKRKFSPGG